MLHTFGQPDTKLVLRQISVMVNNSMVLRYSHLILGAHTLGRARRNNSGFHDKWVEGEFKFDNEFYVDIIEKSWVQVSSKKLSAQYVIPLKSVFA